MLTATLGGLIKDYRLKKRLSQQEVSLRIGWSDCSRLSKIEQGRVGKPTIETIEKIINALALTEQEKGEFLLIGGYLPNDQEIINVVKRLRNKIDNWPYPAFLIDYSWRLLYCNSKTNELFGLSPVINKNLFKKSKNILEVYFENKQYEKSKDIRKIYLGLLANYQKDLVVQFKKEQQGREDEKWYKELIKKLMKNSQFRLAWAQTRIQEPDRELSEYEYKEVFSAHKKKSFKYHVFTSRLVNDQRFQIIFYIPANGD